MKTNPSSHAVQQKIEAIQKNLLSLGPMHPGSISRQFQVCGRPGCRCQHPTKPRRHGPYAKLAFVHRGKKVCRFVRAQCIQQIQTHLVTYKRFRQLTNRWIELSIQRDQIDFFTPAKPKPAPRK